MNEIICCNFNCRQSRDCPLRKHSRPMERMVTTSAGITIGIAHKPRPQPLGEQAEVIQAALLKHRASRHLTGWRRLLRFLWDKA